MELYRLSSDGKKVLNYVWDKSKQDWKVSELGTKSLYDIKLDLEFKTEGAYQDNRLISYNLTGKYPDTNNKLSIDTAISALACPTLHLTDSVGCSKSMMTRATPDVAQRAASPAQNLRWLRIRRHDRSTGASTVRSCVARPSRTYPSSGSHA